MALFHLFLTVSNKESSTVAVTQKKGKAKAAASEGKL
jgi:hypothetical protein